MLAFTQPMYNKHATLHYYFILKSFYKKTMCPVRRVFKNGGKKTGENFGNSPDGAHIRGDVKGKGPARVRL